MRLIIFTCSICIMATLLVAGCGGNKAVRDKSPYADYRLEDINRKKLKDPDVETLYKAGHAHLLAGNWNRALRALSEIEEEYTFSSYATQANLEMATAHYMRKDYDVAIAMINRFLKEYPRHENLDYMVYLRGMAQFAKTKTGRLSFNADKRDIRNLEQAFNDFQLLLTSYPDSEYARDGRQHMLDIQNRLAHAELEAAEYYLNRRVWIAAIDRGSHIIERYQRSTATPRALEIMEEAYQALGLTQMAADTHAMLEVSYPDYLEAPDEFNVEHGIEKPKRSLWQRLFG